MTNLITRIESAEGPTAELFREAWEVAHAAGPIYFDPHRFLLLLGAEAWIDASRAFLPNFADMQITRADGSYYAIVDYHSVARNGSEALALLSATLKARGLG